MGRYGLGRGRPINKSINYSRRPSELLKVKRRYPDLRPYHLILPHPRLRFDLFDSCARYKFSSFIQSFIHVAYKLADCLAVLTLFNLKVTLRVFMLADSVDVTVSTCRVPRYIIELSADEYLNIREPTLTGFEFSRIQLSAGRYYFVDRSSRELPPRDVGSPVT